MKDNIIYTVNGGFPPLKLISEKKEKILKKERGISSNINNLNIKNILSSNISKPMIDLNKSDINIIDSL
jgi:hypothetical protein